MESNNNKLRLNPLDIPLKKKIIANQSVKSLAKSLTARKQPRNIAKLLSSAHTTKNECPGRKSCLNYQSVIALKLYIQKLNTTIEQLTKINDYLNYSLSQKEKLIKEAMNNYPHQHRENVFHSLSPRLTKSFHKTQNYYTKIGNDNTPMKESKPSSKKFTQLFTVKSNNKSNKSNREKPHAKVLTESNLSLIKPKEINKNTMTSILSLQNLNETIIPKMKNETHSQLNHYEQIKEILNKNQKNKLHSNISGISFLALSDIKLKEIAHNDSINLICKLASSDELFVQSFTRENRDTLIQYCDIIGSIAKDFQSSIDLIQRVKQFLTSSVQLINSILSNNSIQVFIENTAKILSCEKASLFLYDSISDKLISYTSEGRGLENKSKVRKDKGEVGQCYLTGEKIMLDHGLKEDNNNRTDTKVRNMICYPLHEIDGDVFGVIQATNKQNEHFNSNDEELLDVFSNQASGILQSMKNNESISTQLLRLKLIVNYSVEIASITSGEAFAKKTEQMLMSLFSSPNSIVYFNDNKGLYNYTTKELITQKNIGIISYVIKKKECHGCFKAIHCRYYNSIVDISTTDSLITYPIVDKTKDIVIGVLQTQFFSKLNKATEKPKKNDLIILNILEQCFVSWYERNKDNVSFN